MPDAPLIATDILPALRAVSYLRAADTATLERLRAAARLHHAAADELLFPEGGECAGLHLIAAGRVKVFKLSPEGREHILLLIGPGSSFNEVSVLDGGPNPASAMAVEPSVLWVIHSKAILDEILNSRALTVGVIQFLATRCRTLVGMVEDLSLRSVTARLAKLLIDQAEGRFPGPVTREQLAGRLGTVREVVTRALRALENDGLIRLDRHRIVILDREGLEKRAQS